MDELWLKRQPLTAELSHFISCVNGEATPRISGENAFDALKVIWEVEDKLGLLAHEETSAQSKASAVA